MTDDELWASVDRLIDRAGSLDDLRSHGLHLLGHRRWRALGRDVPMSLAADELFAVHRIASSAQVLQRARDAYDGALMILKGPEVAALYPSRELRPSADIDLLADEPEAAHSALRAAGFEPVGRFEDPYYVGLHHLRPLRLVGFPMPIIEVHWRPNWVDWAVPPSVEELFSVAVESASTVPGFVAPPPAHHALILAAHSWGEKPLRRILDLVDVAAMSAGTDRETLRALASSWDLSRMWDSTDAAVGALLRGEPTPWSIRMWARDLKRVQARSVLEDHTRRWLGPFWALPPRRAMRAVATAVVNDLTPAPGETNSNKLTRMREAILHPARPHHEHEQLIGPKGIQPRHKRR